MNRKKDIRREFIAEADYLNLNFNPLRAALILARLDDEALDPAAVEKLLAEWAQDFAPALLGDDPLHRKFNRFNQFFSQELGFRLSRSGVPTLTTLHPHRVIESRRGRPEALALIYHDLARRLGIPLRALAMPGAFLFASPWLGEADFVDPAGARIISHGGLQRRLEELFSGRRVVVKPKHLESISDRRLFERYLVTLKGAYLAGRLYEEALRSAEWRLLLDPSSDPARIDLGFLLYDLNRFGAALNKLKVLLSAEAATPIGVKFQDRAQVCALLASVEKASGQG